jgi:hypothetical protein
MAEGQWLQLISLLAVLALVGPGAYAMYRKHGNALPNIAIWLALALGAALLYLLFESN